MLGFFLAKNVPLRISYGVAEVIARLFYIFSTRDRRELGTNLRVVLGEDTDDDTIKEHEMAVFSNFSKYLTDFFKFPRYTREYISRNINLEGREYIDECLAEGNGLILVSIHLGNWELGGAIVGGLGYSISAIVLEQKNRWVNKFFVQQRAINGLTSIPLGLQVKECFQVLKRNEVLAIVGDKNYTSYGIYVDFFGKKALMPKGAAVFSLKTGAPIIFTAVTREKDNTCKMSFEKPIRYKATGDEEADVKGLMEEYLKSFEKCIRENPDQWYAFRKIWNPGKITQ
jgi:KDO2-lipid IV(A) lauroyltransferase